MRNLFLSFSMLFVTLVVSAQTIDTLTIFSENFDGTTHQMTTSNGVNATGDWFLVDTLYSSYNKSIHSPIYPIDAQTTVLKTPNISYASGATNYYLTFNHIAKINNFDQASIEYRLSTGISGDIIWSPWLVLFFSSDSPIYGGEGTNIIGGQFNQRCYNTWLPNDNSALPTNDWWKTELIDITSFLNSTSSDSLYFQIRFSSINNSGQASVGWFIDDIRILATGENVGIDYSTLETIEIYPNPVVDQINIKNCDEVKQVEIFSMDGKLVKSVNISGKTLDIQDLTSGFYMAKIVAKNEQFTFRKFIKQ